MNKKDSEALYDRNFTAIYASLSPDLGRDEARMEAHERAVEAVFSNEERVNDLHYRVELAKNPEGLTKRGLLFIDKSKRWRKFWITDEELSSLNGVEGPTRDLLLEDIFAGYGVKVEGHRDSHYDQREFTAQVL